MLKKLRVGSNYITLDISRKKDSAMSVVISHGLYNDMRNSLVERLFSRLVGKYNVLRFNFSFAGKPESMDAEQCAKELKAAVGFLGGKKTVLVGKSLGGRISSLVAAEGKHGISKVIVLGFYLHEENAPSTAFDLNGIGAMKTPLVIIKGGKDPYCNEKLLKKLLPRCQLHVISDADHSFKPVSDKGSKESNEEKVVSFVLDELEK